MANAFASGGGGGFADFHAEAKWQMTLDRISPSIILVVFLFIV